MVERHDSTAVGDAPEHVTQVEQLREESDGPRQRPLNDQRMQPHVLARNKLPYGTRVRVSSRIADAANAGRARSGEAEVTGLERAVKRQLGVNPFSRQPEQRVDLGVR